MEQPVSLVDKIQNDWRNIVLDYLSGNHHRDLRRLEVDGVRGSSEQTAIIGLNVRVGVDLIVFESLLRRVATATTYMKWWWIWCWYTDYTLTWRKEIRLYDFDNRETLKRIREQNADDESDVHKHAQNGMLRNVQDDDLLHVLSVTQVSETAECAEDYEDDVDVGVEETGEEMSVAFHAAVDRHNLF